MKTDVFWNYDFYWKYCLDMKYNVGGHNEMTSIDIIELTIKELGKGEDLITYVTDRKGRDFRYAIDSTKNHVEMGWLSETMFADGIKNTLQWYLENKDWWQENNSGEYQNGYEQDVFQSIDD